MTKALSHRALLPAARLLLLPALALFLIACEESSPEPPAAGSREASVLSVEDRLPPTVVPQLVEASATAVPLATTAPTDTALPPAAEPPPAPTHEVVAGETLTSISDLYGVSATAIISLNDISDPNLIHAGQVLVVPTPGAEVTQVPPSETAVSPFEPTSGGSPPPDQRPTLSASEPLAGANFQLPNGVLCPGGEAIIPEDAVLIGRSVLCNIPIVSYQIGAGPKQVILIGGIHGGYEWNTTLLAYAMYDYLAGSPGLVPESISVHIIPNANPDGLYMAAQKTGLFSQADVAADTTPGRFNGRDVDLNRNWDCSWAPRAYWRDWSVSGGSQALSEPETQALLTFIVTKNPEAVLFWHSAANLVIPNGCGAPGPRSIELAHIFAGASNYPYADEFNSVFPLTGDAGDSLALRGIVNFTVEMTTHQALDFEMNRDGLLALLQYLDAA